MRTKYIFLFGIIFLITNYSKAQESSLPLKIHYSNASFDSKEYFLNRVDSAFIFVSASLCQSAITIEINEKKYSKSFPCGDDNHRWFGDYAGTLVIAKTKPMKLILSIKNKGQWTINFDKNFSLVQLYDSGDSIEWTYTNRYFASHE
jgi:hypothetical protein